MSRARRLGDAETPVGTCPHGAVAELVADIEREGVPCAWPLLSRSSADCDEDVIALVVYEGHISAIVPGMFVVPTCATHGDAVQRWAGTRTVADKAPIVLARAELASMLQQFHGGDDPLCQELPLRVALAPRD